MRVPPHPHPPATNPRQHPEPTDELLPQLVSLPEVVHAEDEGVDDAEHGGRVRGVLRGLQLVHDHAEAVLLHLHVLEATGKKVQPHASRPVLFRESQTNVKSARGCYLHTWDQYAEDQSLSRVDLK